MRDIGRLNALKLLVWLLVVSDKTPSVRTCGLKPSTLKQLGQPIQQPSSTGEVKVRPIPFPAGELSVGAGCSKNRASIQCPKALGKKTKPSFLHWWASGRRFSMNELSTF